MSEDNREVCLTELGPVMLQQIQILLDRDYPTRAQEIEALAEKLFARFGAGVFPVSQWGDDELTIEYGDIDADGCFQLAEEFINHRDQRRKDQDES